MADTRTCEQCGALFTPRREHARFCRPRCRVAWNREHTGDPQAEASALEWSTTAMRDAIERLARDRVLDHGQGFAVIQRGSMAGHDRRRDLGAISPPCLQERHEIRVAPARRRAVEGTFAGLRFVRNQMGYHLDPADFIHPEQSQPGADQGGVKAWDVETGAHKSRTSDGRPPRRAGRGGDDTVPGVPVAQLAGHTIGETFGEAAAFLKLAAPYPVAA